MKKNLVFSTQNESEKIIKVLNKHDFLLFSSMVIPVILFSGSLVLMLLFFTVYYILLAGFFVLVFSVIWGFYAYFTWTMDKYIITDQKIVDIDQVTLFIKSQKEAYLDKIQDVSFGINGFWGSIFRFGTVTIQTAGETPLTLDDISRPDLIQKIIFDLARSKQLQKNEDLNLLQKMAEIFKNVADKENS